MEALTRSFGELDVERTLPRTILVHELPGQPVCKFFQRGRCRRSASECMFSHSRGKSRARGAVSTDLTSALHVEPLTMFFYPRRKHEQLAEDDVEGTRERMQLMTHCFEPGFALKSERDLRRLERSVLSEEEDFFTALKPPMCSLLIAAAYAERHKPDFRVDDVQVVSSRHVLRKMVHSSRVRDGEAVLRAVKCGGLLFLMRAALYEANDGDVGHQFERMVTEDDGSQELRRVVSVRLGENRILMHCETDAMEDDGITAVEVKTLPPRGLSFPGRESTWLQCVLAKCEVFVSARKEYLSGRDEYPMRVRLSGVKKQAVRSSLGSETSVRDQEAMLASIDRVLSALLVQVEEGTVYELRAHKRECSTEFRLERLPEDTPLPMTQEIVEAALRCGRE